MASQNFNLTNKCLNFLTSYKLILKLFGSNYMMIFMLHDLSFVILLGTQIYMLP